MSERQLLSLESKFTEGNFYDLLQSYKALYFRFSSQKKYKETVNLLVSGTLNFLKYEQYSCAAELAKNLVETYKNFQTPYSNESKVNIVKIFKEFKGEDSRGKVAFMRDAIDWSAKFGSDSKGSPEFHTLLANSLSKEHDFIDAQKHFIFSDSPQDFSLMLKSWSSEADEDEKDLFITRAIFGYLCVKNLKDANTLYQDSLTWLKEPNTPLLNFDRYLLLTLERDALPLFNILRQKYAIALKRDPQFSKYLDQIANVFYKVPVQNSSPFSFLTDILGGLVGGGGNSNSSNNNNNSNSDSMDTDGPTIEEDMLD
ncbi:hypothetical protein CYY_002210 [Polysphondylium violaceum]|uniref:DUF410 family protein n=1 Tax=Polysphondylium violaceum TaxID=133409 RepID=A0A8J4V0Z1_9MYCE|nr:hypothetical protein CYY_002210 [Polysphondylium violaceum]